KSVRTVAGTDAKMVALTDIKKFFSDFDEEIEMVAEEPTASRIKEFVDKARTWIREFITTHEKGETTHQQEETGNEINDLQKQKKEIEQSLSHAEKDEKNAQAEYEKVKTSIEGEKDASRDAEREVFRVMAEQNEIRSTLQMISVREEKLAAGLADFKREIEEGGRIIGRDIHAYETSKEISAQESLKESREKQHDRAKMIEKIKIRLEDDGAVSADEVLKEYKETSARDEFLGKELLDLESSAKSLEALITDLGTKLNTLFDEGIHKINTQFKEFFMKMFGGGSSGLKVVEEKKRKRQILDEEGEMVMIDDGEDEEKEIGVEIEVSLPRKKIKGLEMLSGGERALTSIALLFAISQVNPPPFIILDETDAALDEANSKKYGDMLELLSKHSQLIVITHNRETMSRAGVLYGVTMGKDGASKLLSIAFNEALAVAK
ncbi:MAG TPA: hypothetical protein VMR73_02520, partial [Candidatus Paceibacterota bacterium]|nr:hypothetical protein [Candidatus Paceibacterota bacterium]